jgi:hypothetical protein
MRIPTATLRYALLGGTLLLVPVCLAAQSPRQTPGAWIAAGVTVGSSELSCDACGTESQSHTGFAPGATLGYSVSRSLALALDLTGTASAHDDVRERQGFVTLGAVLFPVASMPFSLSAGAGFTRYSQDIPRTGGVRDQLTSSGFGWRAGIAYDIAISPSVGLVPSVQYLSGGRSALELGNASSGYDASHKTVAVSVRLVWNFTANPFALGARP